MGDIKSVTVCRVHSSQSVTFLLIRENDTAKAEIYPWMYLCAVITMDRIVHISHHHLEGFTLRSWSSPLGPCWRSERQSWYLHETWLSCIWSHMYVPLLFCFQKLQIAILTCLSTQRCSSRRGKVTLLDEPNISQENLGLVSRLSCSLLSCAASTLLQLESWDWSNPIRPSLCDSLDCVSSVGIWGTHNSGTCELLLRNWCYDNKSWPVTCTPI